jgi:hypothetical protein
MSREPVLTMERSLKLREKASIIPLTFGRARIVVEEIPNATYMREFW